jgi:1-acyl-sn-glycerol-3-phosphate acyltransferase
MIHGYLLSFLGIFIKRFRGKIIGRENVPNGGFVAAANHVSFVDDFVFPYTLIRITDRPFHIFVNSRFYKNFFSRKFLEHYDCLPVDAAKDVADGAKRKVTNEKAMEIAIDALKNDRILYVFPEGGRSSDGKLRKAKIGAARAALSARVPILPVGIKGSYEIMPKGAKFPKIGKKADLIIGKPIHLDEYNGKEKDYKTLEEVTSKVMKEIGELIGQEYKY